MEFQQRMSAAPGLAHTSAPAPGLQLQLPALAGSTGEELSSPKRAQAVCMGSPCVRGETHPDPALVCALLMLVGVSVEQYEIHISKSSQVRIACNQYACVTAEEAKK